MSLWPPNLEQFSGPLYSRLADAIEQAVQNGVFLEGDKLPSHRDMAYQINVAVGSVAKAYGVLLKRDIVSSAVGAGTIVKGQMDEDRILLTQKLDSIDLQLVTPYPPTQAKVRDRLYRKTLQSISTQWDQLGLEHFPPEMGLQRHREAGAEWLSQRKIVCTAEEVVITNGAQEAILDTLIALNLPSAPVLCEAYTQTAFKNLASVLKTPLKGVAMDEHGIIPNQLEECATKTGARLLIVQPNMQTPTLATMDDQRRQEIVEVARRLDLLIIEVDARAIYREEPFIPLCALAPERTFYVESLSDVTAPGLRAGVLKIPSDYIPQLESTRHALVLATPTLNTELIAQWIKSGSIELFRQEQLQEYRARNQSVQQILEDYVTVKYPTAPQIWFALPPPWSEHDFCAALKARKILITPGSAFSVSRDITSHHVRIAISSAKSRAELEKALKVVRELLDTKAGG